MLQDAGSIGNGGCGIGCDTMADDGKVDGGGAEMANKAS
jgi:hypothetical protein